jgi:hypothetical protein
MLYLLLTETVINYNYIVNFDYINVTIMMMINNLYADDLNYYNFLEIYYIIYLYFEDFYLLYSMIKIIIVQ